LPLSDCLPGVYTPWPEAPDEPGEDAGDPARILDERLARGEIDTDEYAQLREALASSSTRRRAGARSQA
jgi:hypothetical protein